MIATVIRQGLAGLISILGVSLLVFLLIHLIPGDPVEVMLGEQASVADRDALRRSLGLDRTLVDQWWHWLDSLIAGHGGESLYSHRPVFELIGQRLPATAELAGAALLLAVAIALPAGIMAARHRGSAWDAGAMGFSMLGAAIPNFWLGPMLVLVFAIGLGWLPVSGYEAPGSLVLPAITLGTAMAAILARMLRSTLLEVMHEDWLRTARAKGAGPWRVTVHALRNALLPMITLLGLQLGALLAGAVITETVFDWPGIGTLLVESIQRRDYPVVQGCVLLIAVSYVLINRLTELAYAWADPRVRVDGEGR